MGFKFDVAEAKADINKNLPVLYKRFKAFIKWSAKSWHMNNDLAASFDTCDLENIFLEKLVHCIRDFKIDDSKTDEENERIFSSLLKTYVKNKAIDLEWACTRSNRKPKTKIDSLTSKNDDEDDIDLVDYKHCASLIFDEILSLLDGVDKKVFNAKVKGYKEKVIIKNLKIRKCSIKTINSRIKKACLKVIGSDADF